MRVGTTVWPGACEGSVIGAARQTPVACGLHPDTPVATPEGPRAAGGLAAGDSVIQPCGTVRRVAAVLALEPVRLAPVRVRAGAFGPGLPAVDLLLGPAHRIAWRAPAAARLYGTDEVVSAAAALAGRPGVARLAPRAVALVQIAFEDHALLDCAGLHVESFAPTAEVLAALGAAAEPLFAELPRLRYAGGLAAYAPCRLELDGAEAARVLGAAAVTEAPAETAAEAVDVARAEAVAEARVDKRAGVRAAAVRAPMHPMRLGLPAAMVARPAF